MKPEEQPKAPQPSAPSAQSWNPNGVKIGDAKPHPTNPHITLKVTGFDKNGPVYRKLR